jgi:hypothetical protein
MFQPKLAKGRKSFFEYFTEILGWLQIVASPALIGLILSCVLYFSNPQITTLIIGFIIFSVGLSIGIIWANRVWKRKGTTRYLSEIMATPELDSKE